MHAVQSSCLVCKTGQIMGRAEDKCCTSPYTSAESGTDESTQTSALHVKKSKNFAAASVFNEPKFASSQTQHFKGSKPRQFNENNFVQNIHAKTSHLLVVVVF